MDEGEIEVDSITPIGFPDITPELARESGFLGVIDLLKVAKHGKGENIYLTRFHYVRPLSGRRSQNLFEEGPIFTVTAGCHAVCVKLLVDEQRPSGSIGWA